MPAPSEIFALVRRFQLHRESYQSVRYNETQLRREFVDPFFKALGWDVDNEQGNPEAYKDVIHEDAIKIGGTTRAPDYCFLIGGQRQFFVETKKPSVNIGKDISPAFQLRRYAWTAKLPLSILTDFEEFSVYDCLIHRPIKTDRASKARTLYFKFSDYIDRWDDIASIFSRDALLKGSFDKYAQKHKKKRGTAEVDDEFLKEIEVWRTVLARNLALRNRKLSQRELSFAVQRTIDRILFLRICEDRGVERDPQLQALLNGPNVYPRLCELFHQADDRYNSGLFHFHEEKGRAEAPDDFTISLNIDDKLLKQIITNLYYPDCPYEFSVFPADTLGQVYEQFLGKVIRLTSGHQAKIEEKPEVRKAGGVYYTPTYIVEYIVEQTVGTLLEGKTPQQVGGLTSTWKSSKTRPPLAILDPACGSGSFLICVYQKLLDWYRDWYVADGPKKHRDRIYKAAGGDWRLTTDERKRILLSHVYGVDIDPQAVEVTKLSLLLKVLEGENPETLDRQLRIFKERALPDLASHIKCGNALIDTDFYKGQQVSLFDEEEALRINVFDWTGEFADITRRSGFDAVVGNPPWISLTGKFGVGTYSQAEVEYLIRKHSGNTYMPNMYEYFVAQGLSLVGDGGFFGFIVPDRLGFNGQFIALRERILSECTILSLRYKVPFPGVTVDTLVFIFQKRHASKKHTIRISEHGKETLHRLQEDFARHPTRAFECFESKQLMDLVGIIESCPSVSKLKDLCKSTSGFGGKSKLLHATKTSSAQIPTIKGDSIGRYEFRKKYWFDFRRENITGRTTDKEKLGASPKLLIRKTGDRIIATFDDSGVFPEQSLYFLYDKTTHVDYKFLLGILNSSPLNTYFQAKCLTNRRSIAQVKKVDLDELPIPITEYSDACQRETHDRLVELVETMLSLRTSIQTSMIGHKRTVIQRQINATDQRIDELVCELYGLTDEEIQVVKDVTS